MRLSDLRDKEIRSAQGERLGRVHEVHCDKGKILALQCGAASLIERWTGRVHGRRIDWSLVDRVGPDSITLVPDKPKPARRAAR